MDDFKIGDRVYHTHLKRKGVVNDLISDRVIEVIYDKDIFLWTIEYVENLEKVTGFDNAFWWEDDWDRPHKEVPDKIGKWVCESRDLFHYGCRCGQFKRETSKEV